MFWLAPTGMAMMVWGRLFFLAFGSLVPTLWCSVASSAPPPIDPAIKERFLAAMERQRPVSLQAARLAAWAWSASEKKKTGASKGKPSQGSSLQRLDKQNSRRIKEEYQHLISSLENGDVYAPSLVPLAATRGEFGTLPTSILHPYRVVKIVSPTEAVLAFKVNSELWINLRIKGVPTNRWSVDMVLSTSEQGIRGIFEVLYTIRDLAAEHGDIIATLELRPGLLEWVEAQPKNPPKPSDGKTNISPSSTDGPPTESAATERKAGKANIDDPVANERKAKLKLDLAKRFETENGVKASRLAREAIELSPNGKSAKEARALLKRLE